MQWPGSESAARSPRDSWCACLPAGVTAEMSPEPFFMHLDSTGKQAFSRGKREALIPQSTAAPQSVHAEREREREAAKICVRMQVWSPAILMDEGQKSECFTASGCRLFDGSHLCCVSAMWACVWASCVIPEFQFKHKVSCNKPQANLHNSFKHQGWQGGLFCHYAHGMVFYVSECHGSELIWLECAGIVHLHWNVINRLRVICFSITAKILGAYVCACVILVCVCVCVRVCVCVCLWCLCAFERACL